MDHQKITGRQIVAARGLLDWSQKDLAERAGLVWQTVQRLESVGADPLPQGRAADSSAAIVAAIERAGIEFTNGKSPGVRLKAKRGQS
jgi:transcriptional regulator with XRE-family HTH domain